MAWGTANFVQSKANAQLAIIISHFAAVKNMIQFVLPAQRTTRERNIIHNFLFFILIFFWAQNKGYLKGMY